MIQRNRSQKLMKRKNSFELWASSCELFIGKFQILYKNNGMDFYVSYREIHSIYFF